MLRRLKSLTPALLDVLLGFHPLPQCSILTPAALMSHSHTLRMSWAEWHTFLSPSTKNTDQGLGDSEVWKQGHPGIVLPKGFRYSVSWQPAMLSQKQCYLTWLFNHNRAKLYCLFITKSSSFSYCSFMVHIFYLQTASAFLLLWSKQLADMDARECVLVQMTLLVYLKIGGKANNICKMLCTQKYHTTQCVRIQICLALLFHLFCMHTVDINKTKGA